MEFYHNVSLSLKKINPWTFIALLFAAQVPGALVTARFMALEWRELRAPLLLLFGGVLIAVACRRASLGHPPTTGSFRRWVPAAIYFGFIFSLSNRSFEDVQASFNVSLFHPLEYACLGFLLAWALGPAFAKGWPSHGLKVLSIGLACGIFDEVHQALVPGRFPSFGDIVLDFLGLCVGWVIFWQMVEGFGMFRHTELDVKRSDE